jgi:hypothetical protein
MDEQPEATVPAGEKHSSFLPGFIIWPFVILLLYIFSSGPVALLEDKGRVSRGNVFLRQFYAPWRWAYNDTPLRRPLGMYLHFWIPNHFDKNGNEK